MDTRRGLPKLSLTEWAVLALLRERATHGFDVARALTPRGEVGWVWSVPRPLVYRALDRLAQRGLVVVEREEPGEKGPRRTVMALTPAGEEAVRRWLRLPVEHIREIRSELLLKLLFSHRAGLDPHPLLAAQRRQLVPILASLEKKAGQSQGAERTVALYRLEIARAVARFLDALDPGPGDRSGDEDHPTRTL